MEKAGFETGLSWYNCRHFLTSGVWASSESRGIVADMEKEMVTASL